MSDARQLLLIARSGPIADGLLAILTTTSGMQVRGPLDRIPSGPGAALTPPPSDVFVDCGPLEIDVAALVRRIRALWPEAKCVVLADDVKQQRAARKAGADAALIRGCQPEELIATVEGVLTRVGASEGRTPTL
jgi:DNA-binding NarL/FixJ family response regulator